MKIRIFLAVIMFICLFTAGANAAAKTVFIPAEFTSLGLDWDMSRSYESANFVVFWGSIVGTDPANYTDTTLRFNPQVICDTLETVYTKYITEIQFCSDDPSKNLGKYKIIVMMNDTWSSPNGPTGWAYGSAYDNTIGAMWVHPQATADGNVTSHEFAHTLQSMIHIQENPAGGYMYWEPAGFFWESHADFMRAQMYPAAAYAFDMPRWLATSMFHWSSTRHHYDSFRPLFVLQELYGINMVNRLWKESVANEHPLVTLRRLQGWNQAQLNDFMYGYAKRETVYDYPVNGYGTVIKTEMTRLKNQEPHYLWRLYAMLDRVNGFSDRYVVPEEFAPQDYGYNMIPLYPANVSQPVCVKFKGHAEANSYTGWRYGIVSVTTGGTPRYGPVYPDNEKEFAFQPLADESSWFLVVMGAPVTHTSYVWEPGWPKIKRYPYEIRLSSAAPEGWQTNFRSDIRAKYAGHAHPNGGGWTANSATVADTVYVGPRAVVLGNSNISGAVSISGTAWVENAAVSGNVIIDGNARVRGGNISQNAYVTDNAILYNCTVSGSVIAKGDTFDWGSTFSGASVVGGDAEIGSATTDGVYLQCPHGNNGRAENDGKGASDVSNVDVNAVVTPFADSLMQFTGGCVVMTPTSTASRVPSPVSSATYTPTRTSTAVPSSSATASVSPLNTYTQTPSASATASVSPSRTYTITETRTASVSPLNTYTQTPSASATASVSPSRTYTITETRTASVSPLNTYTQTPTSQVPSNTATHTRTNTPVPATPTRTATASFSVTASVSPQNTNTRTPTFQVPSATGTVTPVATVTSTGSRVPGSTPTPTATQTTTIPETPNPSASATASVSPSRTYTITETRTPSVTPTPGSGPFTLDITVFPNPYNPAAGDLKFKFSATRQVGSISYSIYTAAYRRVLHETGIAPAAIISIPKSKFGRFASGTYYLIVRAETGAGEKAVSKPSELIILK